MNKIKILTVSLIVPLIVLIAFAFRQIKVKQDYQQKVVLAQGIRRALGALMIDLREARESTLLDVPPDGKWHNRLAFIHARQGPVEYLIRGRLLYRLNKGKPLMIADYIDALHIRRQKITPNILEVLIESRKNVSLVSNLKIRLRE